MRTVSGQDSAYTQVNKWVPAMLRNFYDKMLVSRGSSNIPIPKKKKKRKEKKIFLVASR